MKSYQSEVSDFCKVSASHVLPLKVVANGTNIISKNVLDSASWMIQYVRTISSMVASLFHSRTETVVAHLILDFTLQILLQTFHNLIFLTR